MKPMRGMTVMLLVISMLFASMNMEAAGGGANQPGITQNYAQDYEGDLLDKEEGFEREEEQRETDGGLEERNQTFQLHEADFVETYTGEKETLIVKYKEEVNTAEILAQAVEKVQEVRDIMYEARLEESDKLPIHNSNRNVSFDGIQKTSLYSPSVATPTSLTPLPEEVQAEVMDRFASLQMEVIEVAAEDSQAMMDILSQNENVEYV